MITRLFWTLLFSMIALVGLVPLNFYLANNFKSPELQREAGLISLTIIEVILVFNTIFQIIDSWYVQHPNYEKLKEEHKHQHPEIPEKYYERSDKKEDLK